MTFKDFGLDPALVRAVDDLGFETPTPIQLDSIPPAMEGRDVLACAMTGSGKTAAFLLPLMHHLLSKPRGTARALILSPTRELAAQIDEHAKMLAKHTNLTSAAVFGGENIGPQERAFRKPVDIIVATPGRLLDHFQYPYARLDGLEFLILDEADRMLDMGFLPDIRRVLKHVPSKRTTYLFSATMPAPIVALTREMLHNPATMNIDRPSKPAVGITHALYAAHQNVKSPLLLHLLTNTDMGSVVVFTRTKHRANRLADYLEKHGISCARLHGNRSQSQRTLALSGFKNGDFRVLVATDIAARGIDVEALSHVVNFDVPHVPDDYIHRVGRTARAETTGDAVTFYATDEEPQIRAIEKALGKPIERKTAEGFDYTGTPSESPERPLADRLAEMRAARSGRRTAPPSRSDSGSRPPAPTHESRPRFGSSPRSDSSRYANASRREGTRPPAESHSRSAHAPKPFDSGSSRAPSHSPRESPRHAPLVGRAFRSAPSRDDSPHGISGSTVVMSSRIQDRKKPSGGYDRG